MLEFDSEKVVATVNVPINLTANDIDNLVVGAIEGGISYWARLIFRDEEWEDKPKGVPMSQWATKLLLEGKTVVFWDVEEDDEKDLNLTLEQLLEGIRQNAMERPHDADLENADATTYDCIFQYALFDELVYG